MSQRDILLIALPIIPTIFFIIVLSAQTATYSERGTNLRRQMSLATLGYAAGMGVLCGVNALVQIFL